MEYPDLSPYTYYKFPLPMRNIGWLGRGHGIPEAEPLSGPDLALLRTASRWVSSLMLGWHRCDWCSLDSVEQGNGEYHYYTRDGEVYAAPVMILHYVEAHGYRPPEAFLTSLRAGGDLPWDERAELLATILPDGSQDFALRGLAIPDVAYWQHRRALDALLAAAHDAEMADCAALEIGGALARLLHCDFAADVRVEALPEWIRAGIEHARDVRWS